MLYPVLFCDQILSSVTHPRHNSHFLHDCSPRHRKIHPKWGHSSVNKFCFWNFWKTLVYIVALIIWKIPAVCQVRLHRRQTSWKQQTSWKLSETMRAEILVYPLQWTIPLVWYSQSISMGNIFADSIASGPEGNLQVVKKFEEIWGLYWWDQSCVLGFTLYRLHTNVDGAFVAPIRTYDRHVYVLDDVTTMRVYHSKDCNT